MARGAAPGARIRAGARAIGMIAAAWLAPGCARRDRAPDAELLVVSGDSTYWVTSSAGAVRIRGVPMLVARVEGRFRELYVADDDRSYYDAVFVGHRLFSRDLERGDSLELHRDTVVQALATQYARKHPDEQPLAPDEPENDNATMRATGDIELLALVGPYLSYEHHTDIEARGDAAGEHRHAYRRGVLDVRTGNPLKLADLFGRAAADSAIRQGRDEWRRARDSLLATPGIAKIQPRVRRALSGFEFDAASFSLGTEGLAPTVRFAVPGQGSSADIEPVELSAQRMPSPAWWPAAVVELPRESAHAATWSRGSDTLTTVADSEAKTWALRLTVGAAGARPVARLSSAVERVMWLDAGVSASARAALKKAFAEAAEYDGAGQVAAAANRIHLGTHVPDAGKDTHTYRAPVAARVVVADDAAGRERARPRVRWRHPRHAGQDGGGLRDAARPDAVRHRVG